jgi:hypothetical protein
LLDQLANAEREVVLWANRRVLAYDLTFVIEIRSQGREHADRGTPPLLSSAELVEREPTVVVEQRKGVVENELASVIACAQAKLPILGTGFREALIEAAEVIKEISAQGQMRGRQPDGGGPALSAWPPVAGFDR